MNDVKDESLILKGDVLWFIVDFNYSFFLLKSWLLSIVPSFCIQVVIKPIWLPPPISASNASISSSNSVLSCVAGEAADKYCP